MTHELNPTITTSEFQSNKKSKLENRRDHLYTPLKRLVGITAIAGLGIGLGTVANELHKQPAPQEATVASVTETTNTVSSQDILAQISNGPEGDYGTYKIPQDHITGIVVEESVKDYATLHDIQLTEGQASANFTSAKEIDERVDELTNGSVQPDTKIDIWQDLETGRVLSALHESDSNQ